MYSNEYTEILRGFTALSMNRTSYELVRGASNEHE